MANNKRMPVARFVAALEAALDRGDGYIMGATGQCPRDWAASSWWFTQYHGDQHAKALYWRAHAARVWDCNGLAEGIYKDYCGQDINTYARENYARWCGIKGAGTIPAARRVPGAAVFWGQTAAGIHHVAYLDRPVSPADPAGDWYLIEARGVMYGVVRTRLSSRKPNYWGWMDRYFDYGEAAPAAALHLGARLLRNGSEGDDVRELQAALIELGYSCGLWGMDGEFGDATELAVRSFQDDAGLDIDGLVGPLTTAALEAALAASQPRPPEDTPKKVTITGGDCFVRSTPSTAGGILGVARAGSVLPYGGETSASGWHRVAHQSRQGWVSGLYGRLSA